MGFLYLLLIYWFGVYYGILYGLPLLGFLLQFLAIAFWIVLKFTGKALLWAVIRIVRATGRACVLAGRGVHFSALLLYFLIDEKIRGAPDDQSDEEPDDKYGPSFDDEADEAAAQSDLEAARALFGLALTCTREELQRVYKVAIRKAHPDLGGSVKQAQELNIARDLIMSAHGWG